MITSPISGRLSNAVGSKVPLVLGSVLTTIAFVVLAFAGSRWEIYVAATLIGAGTGFSFASMTTLIVEAVPAGQTSVATGMNTITRIIGGAIGADTVATVLGAHLLASGDPTKRGYTITFALCAAVTVAGVLAALAVPGRRRPHARPAEVPNPATERNSREAA